MRKVSIVLPTFNGAQYLEGSIESCLGGQTYDNIELVVVDDCSTDDTPGILERYSNDPNVVVIRNRKNVKLPASLNIGFAHTTGDYLTWTSDDNLYRPKAIEKMVEVLGTQPEVGFVYSDYELIDETGASIRRVSAGPPDHLFTECNITCFLHTRGLYEAVGRYDESLFRIEDYDFWLRVLKRYPMAWLPESLYLYRRHAGSLTATDELQARAERFNALHDRHFGPDPMRLSRVTTELFISQAFECHERRDRIGVLRYAGAALRYDPSLLRNRGVLSILMQAASGVRVHR